MVQSYYKFFTRAREIDILSQFMAVLVKKITLALADES